MKCLLYLKYAESVNVGDLVTYIPDPYSDGCDWEQGVIDAIIPSKMPQHPLLITIQKQNGSTFTCNSSKVVKGWVYDEEDFDVANEDC
jgi:hypothetical protein